MNRKAGGNPPQIGETIAGNVTQGNYGPEFKMDYEEMKASQPQRFNGGQSNTGASYTSGGNTSGYNDEREKRIVRQHSQEMALRFAAVAMGSEVTLPDIKKFTDHFFLDAMGLEDAPAETPAAAGKSDDDIPW